MLDILTSPMSLILLFAIFGIGIVGSIVLRKRDEIANIWGNVWAILGSAWGLSIAGSVLSVGKDINLQFQASTFTPLSIHLHIDKLSAFFIPIICIVAISCSIYGIGYIKEYYKRYSIGAFGFFYNAFILGMLLVVTSANGLIFMFGWEIMSLTSYFLVIYDRNNQDSIRSGYVYLIMNQIGAALILFAIILMYSFTGSFDFAIIKSQFGAIPQIIQSVVIGLTFIGLGAKSGIIPFHIWLPAAHPAAPSHVSGLMSGVMIKTGIYMMIRLYLDIFQPISIWWGIIILAIGVVSAILGALYALTEHDIKRLLAYSSIENIGIILLGLGSAMIFSSLGRQDLMLIALVASLFHTFNHAIFKSLLFLGSGSIIHATHTRNMEKYGGLIKVMPYTAIFFFVGAMAISSLPPLNGFFSEWLTFQSLFSGIATNHSYITWIFMFGAGALALTGGLALVSFVNAFGTVFLARPRSDNAKHAKESSGWMIAGMASLAILCVLVGLSSGQIVAKIQEVAKATTSAVGNLQSVGLSNNSISISPGGPTVSGLWILLIGIGFIGAIWLFVRYGVNKKQQIRIEQTWDCGTRLNERMEITTTSFAHSTIRIFHSLLRPFQTFDITGGETINKYAPTSRTVSIGIKDIYMTYAYAPAYRSLLAVSTYIKAIQGGSVNLYVLYIFIILIIILMVGV